MFESEIRIEVERRLQKACDDRATAGLPPPVSVDALRAVVRSDLMREIEAGRLAAKAAPVPPKPKRRRFLRRPEDRRAPGPEARGAANRDGAAYRTGRKDGPPRSGVPVAP